MDKDKAKKILLNPVGGWYYNDSVKQWVYQKPVFNNLFIDTFVIDVAIPLADILKTVGFSVYSTRLLTKIPKSMNNKYQGVVGESQKPRWQECSIQYLKSIVTYEKERERGYIPPEVYSDGKTILEQDANARVNYAKHINADLMVTIDANCYITDPGMEVICNKAVGSEVLGGFILDEVAKRTKAVTRGVSYIEEPEEMRHNSLTCPSVILKCGSAADGNTANFMKEGFWRQWVSLGIFAGVWKFVNK